MPKQIFGIDSTVTTLNRAFNDQSPANSVYNNQVAQATSVGATQFALSFGAGFTSQTEDQLSTKILGNLGLLPNTALQTALKDYLVQVGKANVGIVAMQLGDILAGLENATGDQAAFSAAALAWNNEVTASYTYSANPANTTASPVGPTDTAVTGVTLALTAGDDFISPAASEAKFKTTGNNDTILATTAGFLSATDVVDGGAGVDTLKATLAAAATVAPTLQNIEKVFVTAGAGAKFTATGATGLTELWVDVAAGAAEFSGVNLATTVGIQNSGVGGALTVGFSGATGAADSANVVFADATGNDEVIVTAIETLNVKSTAGTVAATTVNAAKITADLAEKIVISGDQGLTTTVTGINVTSIDSSALTKALGLTFTTTGTTAVAITGGVGADTFNITGTADAKITLVAGDGADTVNINALGVNKVTLGGGADTLNITGLTGAGAKDLDISTAAKLAASAFEVTDFVSGTDVINLTSGAGTTKAAPTGTQLANIAASSSLLTAAQLAATTAGVNKAIAFQYGADTYILTNDGTAALTADDSLIKLTGVASLSGASWTSA
ncbi:bluetail domain-containing putative surface protein [Acidovorax sp. A1169]|uniref:beta strand repeat-containing protein n=1 Tax=Acidovorax sp. A1169 TaxID=3059524 RepID=UPI0027379A81|nr:bluetail domain-containing putative surface protein [Acidovorax sp. A1169]MDP4076487.1 bluetail domain-containing putative surface protein [Acidovorax sp. A1169]